MNQHFRMSKKSGMPPGSLVHVGKHSTEPVRIRSYRYHETGFQANEGQDALAAATDLHPDETLWLNIDGLHDTQLINQIGSQWKLHPLVLEDVLNTTQRPKLEEFDDYLYLVIKMLQVNGQGAVEAEQVSIVLGGNVVISFQEREGDLFAPIRMRLEQNKGRVRKMGADYLLYLLLDAVIDNYFVLLEQLGDRIETVEDTLIENPRQQLLQDIYHLKREVLSIRRAIWPLRETVSGLQRSESELVTTQIDPFLRDLYDHTIQVLDTVDSAREMVSAMLDIYLSSVSNKMNEVMKVLTVFAAIFIPLTFFAGVYGMNFAHIPELGWKWAYPAWWLLMVLMGGALVLFFKKKNWL